MSAPNVPDPSATHGAARPGGTARLDAEIRTLALPAFATLVAEPLLVIADSAIVGHISTEALAGLGVAASVIGLVIGLCIFLAYTTTASVARRLGAGDLRSALASGLDGISLALVVGVVLAVAISSLSPQIIGLYQAAPGVSSQAQTYLRVMAAGLPAVLVMLAATGVLRGLQDTRTPLAVALVMNLVNVALSLMLVFGLGWGIAGAATGSVLSQYAAAAVLAWTVLRGSRRH
ncbi:MAG: MATE family efflux transporter, partial [Propionicimonas sp.]